jgi:hypothetical protein
MEGEDHLETHGEDGNVQVMERGLCRNQPC